MNGSSDKIKALARAIAEADSVLVGAGSGLSTSAGFTYQGDRFSRFFGDFERSLGIEDMYSGCFYHYDDPCTMWAWWSRVIYFNRYVPVPGTVYSDLFELVSGKDYFVLTTNVDHCFRRTGFDKERLFYTQGDYGLWQCSLPCCGRTYDNEGAVMEMMEAQGFARGADGTFMPGGALRMSVPPELLPVCPVCGRPMSMNLRSDDTFVEDDGWHAAAGRYVDFVRAHRTARVLYLELGVGGNTPAIIKYPFWKMTYKNENAVYACINLLDAGAPREIADRSICISSDISEIVRELLRAR